MRFEYKVSGKDLNSTKELMPIFFLLKWRRAIYLPSKWNICQSSDGEKGLRRRKIHQCSHEAFWMCLLNDRWCSNESFCLYLARRQQTASQIGEEKIIIKKPKTHKKCGARAQKYHIPKWRIKQRCLIPRVLLVIRWRSEGSKKCCHWKRNLRIFNPS